MRRVLRGIGYLLGALLGVALAAAVGVHLLAERQLQRVWDIPVAEFVAPTGDSAVAAGERLATLRGCQGCHGPALRGKIFDDIPWVALLPAPNVPVRIAGAADAEVARTLRHGINRDGRGLAVMPSSMFNPLTDADLGAIIAWLRTLPVTPDTLPARRIRILGRLGLVLGEYDLEPELIDHSAPPAAVDSADPAAWGAYLARTICTECHGLNLQGDGASTPNLAIVAGYTEPQFRHLMRTGEPIGGRVLGLMAEVARGRFVHLTDAEISALHQYLSGLAATAPPASPSGLQERPNG